MKKFITILAVLSISSTQARGDYTDQACLWFDKIATFLTHCVGQDSTEVNESCLNASHMILAEGVGVPVAANFARGAVRAYSERFFRTVGNVDLRIMRGLLVESIRQGMVTHLEFAVRERLLMEGRLDPRGTSARAAALARDANSLIRRIEARGSMNVGRFTTELESLATRYRSLINEISENRGGHISATNRANVLAWWTRDSSLRSFSQGVLDSNVRSEIQAVRMNNRAVLVSRVGMGVATVGVTSALVGVGLVAQDQVVTAEERANEAPRRSQDFAANCNANAASLESMLGLQ